MAGFAKTASRGVKPKVMYIDMPIYNFGDIVEWKLVQLSKWLPPTTDELQYLYRECKRICSDRKRIACVAIFDGKIALFVDDLTNGAFDALGSD